MCGRFYRLVAPYSSFAIVIADNEATSKYYRYLRLHREALSATIRASSSAPQSPNVKALPIRSIFLCDVAEFLRAQI